MGFLINALLFRSRKFIPPVPPVLDREALERELASLQKRIQQIRDENRRLEVLNEQIFESAADRGSKYELGRRTWRKEVITYNNWLIAELLAREIHLKKKC